VATGLLSADEIAAPVRSILNRQQNVEVLLDEVTGIDTEKRQVHLKQHVVPYDFLVLATIRTGTSTQLIERQLKKSD